MSGDAKTVDILFFGDLVGKPGRAVVQNYLAKLTDKPDIVIANAENTSHGFGLNQKHYQELLDSGIQILTSGNHIWDQKEIFSYISFADALLRPHNFPETAPGVGKKVFTIETPNGSVKIGVINLIGQVFMGPYNSPWENLDKTLAELRKETPVIFLDFHAEATAEKKALGWYVSNLGVSAMVGTHTHVQTADERILNDRMGYLTDVGFNGSYNSVIGMDAEPAVRRLRTQLPARLDVGPEDMTQLNAVRFTVEIETGICRKVVRINEVYSLIGAQTQLVTTR